MISQEKLWALKEAGLEFSLEDDFPLAQLLAEIEARYPYLWQVGRVENGRYKIALMDEGYNVTSFDADTPEDAAADALIWILKEGVK